MLVRGPSYTLQCLHLTIQSLDKILQEHIELERVLQ